jgi:hypothetical protein
MSMKLSFCLKFIALLGLLATQVRADDAADVTKVAHDFVATLSCLDYDKIASLGRPQDANVFPKPPDNVLNQFRELQNVAAVQDIRRQLADEVGKAMAIDAPAFTPDNTCAIVTVTPVPAEARKFCELMQLYITFVTTAQENKAMGLPPPKIEDIRARIETPGSPEKMSLDNQVASISKLKVHLQLEKTAAGWRINLHAFEATLNSTAQDTP